jgi:glycosyltransferase involved in cell wall biosynthesis/spore maturation protein CgeB
VLLLDTKRSNPNHYLCIALRDALRARPEVEHVAAAGYGDAIRRAGDEHCNLFVAFDGEEMHRETCARLARICGRSLLWVTEDPYEVPVNLANAELFDLVFSNDSASVARYGAKGRHLPLAACPAMHLLDVRADADCRYDLFFAGTAWPNRVALLKRLLGELSGLRVKLALPGNEHLPQPDLPLPLSSYSWRTPNSQFARLANASRVVLTLHREFTGSAEGSPMAATPGPRLFEVALAGGFQLVDLSLPETGRYLEPDRELAGFVGERDAVEKLRHYLALPDERIAMARAAQQRVRSEHTYRERAGRLLAEAATIRPAPQAQVGGARPRVLHVTHNVTGVVPYGGVEIYQEMMGKALAGEFESLYYVPDQTVAGSKCRVLDIDGKELRSVSFGTPAHDHHLTCAERERAFGEVLTEFRIDVVHFQHLMRHVPSLPFVARALGVRSLMSLHDYLSVCQQFSLIGRDGRFCAPERRSETECDLCAGHLFQAPPGSQSCRRAFFGRMLSRIDVLHANTTEVAERYREVYPALRKHPRFEVAGIPSLETAIERRGERARNGPLRVAVPGNFSTIKGGEILLEVFSALRDEPIVFELFGQIQDVLAPRVAAAHLPNVVWHQGYAPGTLVQRLTGFPVSLHASVWPETYCLALSEAWQAGLVPIVADIGALGLRVTDGMNGLKYPHDRPGVLIDLLRGLAADPGRIEAMRANIHPGLWVEPDEHAHWLAVIYRDLARQSAATGSSGQADLSQALTLFDCGVALSSPSWVRGAAANAPLPADLPSPLRRARNFLRRHGVAATVRRTLYEIRQRLRAG